MPIIEASNVLLNEKRSEANTILVISGSAETIRRTASASASPRSLNELFPEAKNQRGQFVTVHSVITNVISGHYKQLPGYNNYHIHLTFKSLSSPFLRMPHPLILLPRFPELHPLR